MLKCARAKMSELRRMETSARKYLVKRTGGGTRER